tara:strand:+ start:626 stop:745 length:120 start_codon:yes stop_codon:yes gene_type:complete
MEVIGAILLAIIITVSGIGLGALLMYGLMTFIVYIEENK